MTHVAPTELMDIALSCIQREYPYYVEHYADGPLTFRRPAEQHPSFYGCSDWHSAVHNHWLLIRLAHRHADSDEATRARAVLDAHLAAEPLARELAYLQAPLTATFERPYGWAWVIRTHAEAVVTPGGDGWAAALQPLRDHLADGLADHFERGLQFPIRTGTHGNTAFALILALEAAHMTNDAALVQRLTAAAKRHFGADVDYPLSFEPDGGDFHSAALSEIAAMAHALEPDEFRSWLSTFTPTLTASALMRPPAFAPDASDPATVHLNGLLLTRAWSLAQIAEALRAEDPWRPDLVSAAQRHFEAAAHVLDDRHYHAMHWTPTFLVLAADAVSALT